MTKNRLRGPYMPPSGEKALRPKNPYEYLPSVPDAVYDAMTSIRKGSPSKDRPLDRLSIEDLDFPFQGPRIKVMHDIALEDEVGFLLL